MTDLEKLLETYKPDGFLAILYNLASDKSVDIVADAQYGLGWFHYACSADLPNAYLKNNFIAYMWLYASAKNGFERAEVLRDTIARGLTIDEIKRAELCAGMFIKT